MEEKRTYLIARLDDEANQSLSSIYNLLTQEGLRGTQEPDFPYHITLGSFETEFERSVVENAKRVCREQAPFRLHLNHIGLFGESVLFLAPAASMELLTLHEALLRCQPAVDVHDWVPHVTLLMDEPENIRKALPIVMRAFSPLLTNITDIGVYEYAPPLFVRDFPFGKTNP